MEKKSLDTVTPVRTSHGCGEKRVLLACADTPSAITQIAVTLMRKGEKAGLHTHPTMEECFFIRRGEMRLEAGGETTVMRKDDFVRIPAGVPHDVEALTDCEMLTIGCAVDNLGGPGDKPETAGH